MFNITKFLEKINSFLEKPKVLKIIKITLFVLLFFISFLLGILFEQSSVKEVPSNIEIYLPNGDLLNKSDVIVPSNDLSAYVLNGGYQNSNILNIDSPTIEDRLSLISDNTNGGENDSDFKIFGSKNGSTYYTKGCTSGNRVKEENRVYFESETDAEDEGYTRSKLCK
jgi:hypothetical protein